MQRSWDGGKLLIALGAVLLLIALFLDWYGAPAGLGDEAVTAWTAFELVDLLLAAIAIGCILAVGRAVSAHQGIPAVPGWLATVGPFAALVIVAASLIDPPPAVANASVEEGGWLALGGAGLMCVGAILGLARISVVVTARDRASGDRREATEPLAAEPAPADPATRRMPRE